MKKLFVAVIFLAAALLLAHWAHAELFQGPDQVIERLESGEINWSTSTVRALGKGAPGPNASSPAAAKILAARAAKIDAVRNLLETVGGIRIDARTTLANYASKSDVVSSRVKGVVKGAIIVDTRYSPDGTAEVVVEAPIRGILAETVYNIIPDIGTTPVPKAGVIVNTGLVIDATGIGAKPAMSPKIVDEDGREVYSSRFVKKEFAVKQGVVGYSNNFDSAIQSDRVKSNPVVVKALKTAGTRGTEIVISNPDSSKLRDRSKNLSFLEQTKVIIVME